MIAQMYAESKINSFCRKIALEGSLFKTVKTGETVLITYEPEDRVIFQAIEKCHNTWIVRIDAEFLGWDALYKIVLDTMCYDDAFRAWLLEKRISHKLLVTYGPSCDWPVVTYFAPYHELKEMIMKHWGDEDLLGFVERC